MLLILKLLLVSKGLTLQRFIRATTPCGAGLTGTWAMILNLLGSLSASMWSPFERARRIPDGGFCALHIENMETDRKTIRACWRSTDVVFVIFIVFWAWLLYPNMVLPNVIQQYPYDGPWLISLNLGLSLSLNGLDFRL